jgi:hypothetical protein
MCCEFDNIIESKSMEIEQPKHGDIPYSNAVRTLKSKSLKSPHSIAFKIRDFRAFESLSSVQPVIIRFPPITTSKCCINVVFDVWLRE